MATCREIKDYLMSQTYHLEKVQKKHVTPGRQQEIWMSMTTTHSDPYNEVYPSILLGDNTVAKSPEKLKSIGITHVVNCACGSSFNMVNTDQDYFEKSGIIFHGIPAVDVWKFKIAPYFQAAVDFIEQALDSGGKVYVHCMAGVSRSSTIVLAFLVLKRHMPLLEAVKTVRENRKILPNDGFLKELVDLNKFIFSPERVDFLFI